MRGIGISEDSEVVGVACSSLTAGTAAKRKKMSLNFKVL